MKRIKKILLLLVVVLVAAVYSYGVWPRPIYDTNVGSGSYLNTGALDEGSEFNQEFLCADSGLCGLTIKLTKMENQTIGTYEWSVIDIEANEVIGTGVINEAATENKVFESASAQKKGTVELAFDEQKKSKNKKYLLNIKAVDVAEDETMAVYITEKNNVETSLKVGNEELEQTSVIKLNYQRFNLETFIVFLGIVMYLTVFVKFMYKLFR